MATDPSSSSRPRVAIFDADAPGALAFSRSLGRANVPMRLYSSRRWPVARFSRYCTSFERCPDAEDARVFLPWLERELKSGRIELVAPTSDMTAYYAAELADAFRPELRRGLPDREAVLTTLFKDRFDAACAQAGFRTPKTYYPKTLEEAHALADTLQYPVIFKPKTHVAAGLVRGAVVNDAAEFRRHYRAYQMPAEKSPIQERYPDLALPLIQEYVPRTLENLYSISGLLGEGGEPLALAASRKIAQWPPALGIGIEFEACENDGLLETGLKLTQAVLGRGMFELELIWDARVEDWVAIDLNPRAHGFISFDVARNNDLPLLWYRMATGQPLPKMAPARNEVRWIHSVPYHLSKWVELMKGPERGKRLIDYVGDLRQQSVDIINDPDDPAPTAAFLALMLRHPGGLVRPFLSWKKG